MIKEAEFIVIDSETTGLNLHTDEILQIAWMCLDKSMQPLSMPGAQGQAFLATRIPQPSWTALDFHRKTGFDRVYNDAAQRGSLITPEQADALMVAVTRPKLIFVGNQVEGFDRRFFERQLPNFNKQGYACLNVSATRALYCNARGISTFTVKQSFGYNHNAWGDVLSCYKEMQFYRELLKEVPK